MKHSYFQATRKLQIAQNKADFEDNSEPAQLCLLTFDFNNESDDGEEGGDAAGKGDTGTQVMVQPGDTAVVLHPADGLISKPVLP